MPISAADGAHHVHHGQNHAMSACGLSGHKAGLDLRGNEARQDTGYVACHAGAEEMPEPRLGARRRFSHLSAPLRGTVPCRHDAGRP